MEFKVLGPLEVRRDEAALPLGGAGQRALLATLILCANQVVSIDRLFGLLWEDEPPDTARHILHINVSRLRKVLEDDPSNPNVLLTRSPGYVLCTPAETIDAVRFQELVESGRVLVREDPARASATLAKALALWRGETLEDLSLDPFSLPGVAQLEELRTSATEDRIDAELALGHHDEVIGDLRRLASEHPLRERITQQLMLALYRSGRQSEALGAYATARSRLASDLGVDPGSALQALEQAVLQHDPSLDLAVDPSRDTPAIPQLVGDSPIPAFHDVRRVVSIVATEVMLRSNLGETLDPEPQRHAMLRCLDATRASIERHGGTLEKLHGDILMAVFGFPRIHEDDALRAIRAAADIREALATLGDHLDHDHGQILTSRIGVNTGEVVTVGDQTMVMGDAANVATRLAHGAAPGDVLLGDDTFVLVRDAVFTERIDPSGIEGSIDPASVYRLIEVAPGVAGFARHLDATMVGRERELSLLRSIFARTVTDEACQLLTVLGAAGVGKSRLLAAFVEELGDRATFLRGRCLPYGDGITFYPLAEALIDVADLDDADTPEAARAKLAALAGSGEDAHKIAERVGQAIGIAGSATAAGETIWAIRVLLERLAADRPVVFMIDDLQWAEPTFLELVEHVADHARDAQILLACTARTELLDDHPGWAGGKLNATSILLEPLDVVDCGSLVANLLGDDTIDEGIRNRIAAVAEGNPLYAEEITGLLVEDGSLVLKDERWVAVGALSDVPVPATISALLAARLDRLPSDERWLIEVGSVMGQIFYSTAVCEMAGEGADAVEVGLGSLVRKQFVRPERADLAETDALGFRHLLIRDAAYASIPKATRAELHERFADWLVKVMRTIGEQDEIVGYHLEQAYRYRTELGSVDDVAKELGRRAGEHLGDAGLRAFARGDMVGSAGLIERAVAILPPDHPRLPPLEDRLVNKLLEARDLARAEEENARHLLCARMIGDRGQEQRAELGALALRYMRSPKDLPVEEIHRRVRKAIDVFRELDDEEGLASAHIFLSEAAWTGGRSTEQLSEAESALVHALHSEAPSTLLMDVVEHIGFALNFGPTPAGAALTRIERLAGQVANDRSAEAAARGRMAWFLALLGRSEEARIAAQYAHAVSQDLGQKGGVAWAEWNLGRIEWFGGDLQAAEKLIRGFCDGLRDAEDKANLAVSGLYLAQLLILLGRVEEALAATDEIQGTIPADDVWRQTIWRATRSIALAHVGRIDEAMPLIQTAEQSVRTTEFVSTLADTMYAKAEVLKIAGRREDAAGAAREALTLYEAKEFAPQIGWTRSILDSLVG